MHQVSQKRQSVSLCGALCCFSRRFNHVFGEPDLNLILTFAVLPKPIQYVILANSIDTISRHVKYFSMYTLNTSDELGPIRQVSVFLTRVNISSGIPRHLEWKATVCPLRTIQAMMLSLLRIFWRQVWSWMQTCACFKYVWRTCWERDPGVVSDVT